MKKFIIPILLLLNFITAAFLIRGLFDKGWACEKGEWINHGGILARKPQEPCAGVVVEADEKKLGGDRDDHGCMRSAGYKWCAEKQKCLRIWEEACTQEEVFNLLQEMKAAVEVDFYGTSDSSMEWNVATSSANADYVTKQITSKSTTALEVDRRKLRIIDDFFKNRGFQRDVYNISAGTVSSSTAFKKDRTVCVVRNVLSGYDSDLLLSPRQTEFVDIDVSCGELD